MCNTKVSILKNEYIITNQMNYTKKYTQHGNIYKAVNVTIYQTFTVI